jgi:hypothetical protein
VWVFSQDEIGAERRITSPELAVVQDADRYKLAVHHTFLSRLVTWHLTTPFLLDVHTRVSPEASYVSVKMPFIQATSMLVQAGCHRGNRHCKVFHVWRQVSTALV